MILSPGIEVIAGAEAMVTHPGVRCQDITDLRPWVYAHSGKEFTLACAYLRNAVRTRLTVRYSGPQRVARD